MKSDVRAGCHWAAQSVPKAAGRPMKHSPNKKASVPAVLGPGTARGGRHLRRKEEQGKRKTEQLSKSLKVCLHLSTPAAVPDTPCLQCTLHHPQSCSVVKLRKPLRADDFCAKGEPGRSGLSRARRCRFQSPTLFRVPTSNSAHRCCRCARASAIFTFQQTGERSETALLAFSATSRANRV